MTELEAQPFAAVSGNAKRPRLRGSAATHPSARSTSASATEAICAVVSSTMRPPCRRDQSAQRRPQRWPDPSQVSGLLLIRVAQMATPCDHRRVGSATPAERDNSTAAVAARALDLGAFFRDAGRALEAIAQHDGRCWMTLDPATGLPTSHVAH